jgi:hypothetical protein
VFIKIFKIQSNFEYNCTAAACPLRKGGGEEVIVQCTHAATDHVRFVEMAG